MQFSGTYTALVTPFHQGKAGKAGKVDLDALQSLIEEQITGGITGIVPVGTTGESPTLTTEEHTEVIRHAVSAAQGRICVIAGTGSNSTAEAIHLTQSAEQLGAHAALIVAPYYNKPSAEGIYLHYKEIAKSTQLPILLYSIPGRCGVEIPLETVCRLAQDCPNIVALKEAGGSVERISQLRVALPQEFTLLSGDDSLTLPFLAVGAQGVISVASNIIPRQVVDLVAAWKAGKPDTALKLHLQFYPLFKGLFVETNPVPIKYALSLLGKMHSGVRLPLCELSDLHKQQLHQLLLDLGLLSS